MRSPRPSILLVPAALAILAAGCAQPEPGPASPSEAARVRPLGRERAHLLQHRLRGELLAALEAGGPAGAVRVCRERAEALAREVGEGGTPAVDLKRVTRKPRVPGHGPDEWEAQALEWFEGRQAQEGRLPEDWVQRLTEGGLRYRYYLPIVMGPACLGCHGTPDQMSDTVKAVLASLYPEDRATAYQGGELRGLVRVEIDAKDLPKIKEAP